MSMEELRVLLFTNDMIGESVGAIDLWLSFVTIILFALLGMLIARKAFKKSLTN